MINDSMCIYIYVYTPIVDTIYSGAATGDTDEVVLEGPQSTCPLMMK